MTCAYGMTVKIGLVLCGQCMCSGWNWKRWICFCISFIVKYPYTVKYHLSGVTGEYTVPIGGMVTCEKKF